MAKPSIASGHDERATEDLLRDMAPRILAALIRRFGDFATAEDAVQEALLAAATQWPEEGMPTNPENWLIRVAFRRMTDLLRAEQARQRRENAVAARIPADEHLAPAADQRKRSAADDTLTLLFLCCHPVLTPASQIALTLRAVGGLGTDEIARAFLVPETTMGQRISRAKQRIRASGSEFRMPEQRERPARLRAVLHVLYLIFNEGYTATSGPTLRRGELAVEAIRLTRVIHHLLPDEGEVAGLLALILLTDARHAARTGSDGELIPMAEQDRGRWDRALIAEGTELVTDAMARTRLGPYQLQAAIAALHGEAATAEETDWRQILALYRLLERFADNPMVTLNHAVAIAMVHGPEAGLSHLTTLDGDDRIAGHHRLAAVRAHLLDLAGDQGAAECYRLAAKKTSSAPERRHLEARAAEVEAKHS
ncbi:RNA polymerase subunit sigma-24 [Prauserella marina]|uniref:RNA polymerase sigma factor, sigma-70 family n=1 Tax=Prauserella marina TaxID=530584 RepID=A0A222VJS2_9PSEU|nr:sigma-70 family RNA polymerase sigma factor [Prauserella marina]ASR34176.1 RNA polymerase subunit sigma-24 [Prauserella marina]PWV70512.1 RNA polymerase ECF family sigma subunit [Prauserella marina]SDE03641.1 RNA polymerase sigma factor, sigma-70 family [Prauserella marina]